MSDSLWPHELQHARPPCPSPTPGVYPNPCALSRWCHPAISSSVVPFSSCPQSFPASGSFQMSKLFTSGGQSIGVSVSTSVLPVNIQDWAFFLGQNWSVRVAKHHLLFKNILPHPILLDWKELRFTVTLCLGSWGGRHIPGGSILGCVCMFERETETD